VVLAGHFRLMCTWAHACGNNAGGESAPAAVTKFMAEKWGEIEERLARTKVPIFVRHDPEGGCDPRLQVGPNNALPFAQVS